MRGPEPWVPQGAQRALGAAQWPHPALGLLKGRGRRAGGGLGGPWPPSRLNFLTRFASPGGFLKLDFMRRQRKAPNCAGLVQRCGTMVTPGDARTAPRLYRFFLLASSLRFIQIQGSRIEPNPPLGSSPCCPLPRYALWSGAIFVRPALRAPCCHPNHAWLFFFFWGGGEVKAPSRDGRPRLLPGRPRNGGDALGLGKT